MDTATGVQIQSKTDCISHYAITFRKVINPTIFPPSLKNSRADRALSPWYGNQSRRRKTEFKPVKLRLKNWPCVIPCLCWRVCKYIWIYIYIYKIRNPNGFCLYFFVFLINFIFLTAWWLLFCKKLHETVKFHELNIYIYIYISNIYLFIII